MSALTVLAVLAALYGAFAFLFNRFALGALTCTRAFSRSAVFEGEEGEMIEVVRNDGPLPIPWLRLESRIPPYMRFGRQENLDFSGETHCCSLFTLMPFQQIRRRHRVRFLHRGAYNLGNASLTAGDALGLIEIGRDQRMSVPVLVYPRLLDERELPAPLALMMEEIVSRRLLLTDPFLIRGIRPYRPTDPVRDIHWPATAKTGEAQVRLHDSTARARLMVLLNGALAENQWSDRPMDYETGAIERGISIAATLCIRALRAGLSVGFAANLPQEPDGGSTLLLPSGGIAREEELLSAFARLLVVRTADFSLFLTDLAEQSELEDLDVLALSCYDSPRIRASMARLEQKGCHVRLHLLREEGADAA